MAKYTARDIAEYFLSLVDSESGDYISNLKIQKLVYYAQGLHLAATGEPLFDDEIVAWTHGPVVVELYHQYKGNGSTPVEPTIDYCLPEFDENTQQFLDEVYRALGQYSAWKLREMSHQEKPWLNAERKGLGSVITHTDMCNHFKPFIKVT